MPIVYRKLFHLLIDRNIKKGELQKMAGITPSIMARLGKDETVKTDTIGKICKALGCQPGDIMEYTDIGMEFTVVDTGEKFRPLLVNELVKMPDDKEELYASKCYLPKHLETRVKEESKNRTPEEKRKSEEREKEIRAFESELEYINRRD